jgi:hypothetical protein
MPMYRLTFEDENRRTSEFELEAPNFPAAFQCQSDMSHLIKIERINRITGLIMGGVYQREG